MSEARRWSIVSARRPWALGIAFAAGAAFGAAIMYLVDPDGGRRRRALIRDQMVHAGHEIGDLGEDARGRAQDIRNRAQGAAHEVTR